MEQNETILISGRIVAEFEDDATQLLSNEPELDRLPQVTVVLPTSAVPQGNDAASIKPG